MTIKRFESRSCYYNFEGRVQLSVFVHGNMAILCLLPVQAPGFVNLAGYRLGSIAFRQMIEDLRFIIFLLPPQ